MNYSAIKHSHDELTEAIRRHNQQVADRITEEFVKQPTLEQAQNRQRAQIQRALEALHKGNLDEVKRILEEI